MQNLTKGVRVIIVHAGSSEGFIPNALLTYRAEIKTADYHDNMNTENYLKWLKEKVIPNLPKDAAVIVMDNACSEKIPTFNSNKIEMLTWLRANGIKFQENQKN